MHVETLVDGNQVATEPVSGAAAAEGGREKENGTRSLYGGQGGIEPPKRGFSVPSSNRFTNQFINIFALVV
jgi:hypothetical protein